MLHFFPEPYEDELFYSIIARYHYYSASTSHISTRKSIMNGKLSQTILLPMHINDFQENFPKESGYTSFNFINGHTILPLYYPFLSFEKKEQIINAMKFGSTSPLLLTGLSRTNFGDCYILKYCPLCCKEDYQLYGELYFHRAHQVPGVVSCYKHFCLLYNYQVSKREIIAGKFLILELSKINTATQYEINEKDAYHHNLISQTVSYIINTNLSHIDFSIVINKYYYLLYKKKLILNSGHINRPVFFEKFKTYYGEELLSRLKSNLVKKNNWLARMCEIQKHQHVVNPIRHILLTLFLCNNIETFFNEVPYIPIIDILKPYPRKFTKDESIIELHFGKGPWICRNPAADHYGEPIITDCSAKYIHKAEYMTALFSCSCGYSYYCREEIDQDNTIRKKYLVKEYGEQWRDMLKNLILDKGITNPHRLAALMSCEDKTIVRQAKLIGLESYFDIKDRYKKIIEKKPLKNTDSYIKEHRQTILAQITDSYNISRNEIRKNAMAAFDYLRVNDRAWLESVLPECIPEKERRKEGKLATDWDITDTEIQKLLNGAYIVLISQKKMARVSFYRLTNMIGRYKYIKLNLYRLPKTKQFLDSVVETKEEYQLRRLEIMSKEMYEEEGYVEKWGIIIRCGFHNIYNHGLSKKVKDKIEYYLSYYNSF